MPPTELKTTQDLMQTLSSLSHRTYLLFSLVFFGAFLYVTIGGIVPKINNIMIAYESLQTAESELKNLQDKKKQVDMIANDSDYVLAPVVEDILYTTNPFMPMMYTLSEVTAKNNLTNIVSLELSPGLVATASSQLANRTQQSAANRLAANKDSEGFTIFLEIRGSYLRLANFLRDIENYAPFNSVAYSEITNSLNGTATGRFEIMAQYYPPTLKAKLTDKIPSLTDDDKATLALITRFTIPNLNALQQGAFTNYGRDNPFLNVVAPAVQEAEPVVEQ